MFVCMSLRCLSCRSLFSNHLERKPRTLSNPGPTLSTPIERNRTFDCLSSSTQVVWLIWFGSISNVGPRPIVTIPIQNNLSARHDRCYVISCHSVNLGWSTRSQGLSYYLPTNLVNDALCKAHVARGLHIFWPLPKFKCFWDWESAIAWRGSLLQYSTEQHIRQPFIQSLDWKKNNKIVK